MAILECKDLTKYYDRTLGLDHLSLQLEPGRINKHESRKNPFCRIWQSSP